MTDKENVTIIIAAHNNVSTIERAIKSVTRGNRPANQIIVADNDSTDGTYDLLCKILGAEQITVDGKTGLPPEFDGQIEDTPIKIFRKRSSTTGHTLNTAMQMKWQGVTIFGFMDPNSWYAPDKISQAIRIFHTNPSIACVVSDFDNHYSDRRIERVFRCSFDIQRFMCDFPYDRNFLIRTPVFQKLKAGFNEQMPIRDEYDLLLRVSEVGLIYHIPAPLHNNTVVDLDTASKQAILQAETFARQYAKKRRSDKNG